MENWPFLLLLSITLTVGNSYAEPLAPKKATAKEPTPPIITAIKPEPVIGSQQRQWIKIIGSSFTPDSKVILQLGDQAFPIPSTRTKFVSDGELDIYANVSTGPSTWTAQVSNQKGKSQKLSFDVK